MKSKEEKNKKLERNMKISKSMLKRYATARKIGYVASDSQYDHMRNAGLDMSNILRGKKKQKTTNSQADYFLDIAIGRC